MGRHRYAVCNVFTDQRFGGNPLAVVLDAKGIDDATLQSIARDFNLSETSFVLPPSDPRHAALVRIFTPGGELPFAGHPTIGTAFVLTTLGIIDAARDEIVFEEGVGPVPVRIERDESRRDVISCTLTTARTPQRLDDSLAVAEAAALLGLGPADIASPPQAWSCGVPFMIVPLNSVEALARSALVLNDWRTALASSEAHMVYPVARLDATTWSVRMFAPKLNVAEDPATGAAAASFAGWLAQHERIDTGTHRCQLRQGEAMGRPSVLDLEFDCATGQVSAVRVGGSAVFVAEGELRL
jgi:trans-2,3-dihydro-3-hydroxyanthranilate isomerase